MSGLEAAVWGVLDSGSVAAAESLHASISGFGPGFPCASTVQFLACTGLQDGHLGMVRAWLLSGMAGRFAHFASIRSPKAAGLR